MDDNQLKPFLEKGTKQIQKAKEISLSTEKNNEISKEDYIKFRKIFVTKVYSILAIQFTITIINIFFVTLNLFMISSCLRILFGIEYSKLIINGCCLIVFSTYIIYDTQLILGNKREKFNNNDHVLAAMCLYIDIINLFIEMIKIVAASLNENVDDKDNKDDGFIDYNEFAKILNKYI